jgi:DNA-binding transcriptional LysR family regulator
MGNPPRVDLLAQMATFVRVVEGRSLSAAARASRLSLPAVSRQLRALEEDLGVSLVVRSTRRLHVTDAGRQWYGHCVRVLGDVDRARDAVRGGDKAAGTLVVSASLTYGSFAVVPRLAELSARHPELSVELRLEDHVADLVGEGVDVALRTGPSPPDSTAFIAHPLGSMTRVLVAAPRWLRKRGAPREPEGLARHECLTQVTPAGTTVRWALRRRGEERTVEVRGRLRTNAPSALRTLALDGAGVAYLPEWLVADDLAAGRLRRVLPAWRSPPITAWAVHRTELRGMPKLRAFLELMSSAPPARARPGA